MAAAQNSTAKKAPPKGYFYEDYEKAFNELDSDAVLKMGLKNKEIGYPNDEGSDSPTSAELDDERIRYQEEEDKRQRRLEKARSENTHNFIEILRSARDEEGYWTNLDENEYMKLLDILDMKIEEVVRNPNADERIPALLNILKLNSRFRVFCPTIIKMRTPGKRMEKINNMSERDDVLEWLETHPNEYIEDYSYGFGIKRKSKKSKRKSKKSKRKSKKSKRKSRK